MNLFLDAFDRVFNPNTSSSSKRRASSSGLVTSLTGPSTYSSSSRRTTNTTMTTTTTTALLNSPQKNYFRRQSGGAVNAGFQNEFVALTIGEPEEPSTSTRIQRQQSASSASRSRSSNAGGSRRKRKKSISASGSEKSQSFASLIFSALSSPSTNGNDKMRRRKLNNENRSSGRRKHLPPRQWSVPEREGNNDYNREPQTTIERNIDVAEPFRLIQKAYSLSCEDPLSSSRSSLMGSPHSPLSISSHNCFNSGSTVLFGFVTCQSSSASSPINASLYSFWEKFALESDSALNSEIYFLRCIDSEPKLPFIYYATFSPLSDHEQHINNLGETLVDVEDISARIQLGCYEQLYTLERAAASPSPGTKNSLKHQGFIFIFFRLLGENCASSNADLESRWLDWTGAGQIYKYSPRCWDLQKVCLLKSVGQSTTSTPFVYILLCEFNSILHPSNTIAALDFCERLRSRNCGFVALYKVSQSHCPSQKQQKQYPYQQQKSFEYQPQKETNLSPNWPLQQHYRRQQLGRMGRSHDERVSIGARKESQQHSPPSPRPISQRENEKGHSQQSLNDKGGAERLRRLIWAREQQHSLGWDQQQPQQWFGQTTNGTLL
uniref:DUF7153 domain-containing protein n=1 Tax=Meloidogyne incognita TaxID=6306 RepID=A0A914NLV7_MELIC